MNPVYKWRVAHPEYGVVNVAGADKLEAVQAAARLWRVPWTTIARICEFEKLGEERDQ